MRRIAGATAVLLVVAACSGGTETSTTAAATTTSLASLTNPPTSTTTATPTTTSTTTTQAPSAAPGAQLLISGPSGVFLVQADGSTTLLVDSPAVFATDDLDGGLLFQQQRSERQGASVVYRVRADGAEASRTLVPTSEQGLTLNGVAVVDDETFVYYTRFEGTQPEDTRSTLRRYSLSTREVTELAEVGGWESGAFPISVSQSLILYNWFAEASSGMEFTDLAANAAAVAANPSPEEGFFDCGPCPRLGELSHDGQRLAYIESPDGVPYVIIKHVASGAEIRRILLGDQAWSPLSLDLSANHLVVNRRTNNGTIEPWVYDLTKVDPEPVQLSVPGEAYLTLAPVVVFGPVPAP